MEKARSIKQKVDFFEISKIGKPLARMKGENIWINDAWKNERIITDPTTISSIMGDFGLSVEAWKPVWSLLLKTQQKR